MKPERASAGREAGAGGAEQAPAGYRSRFADAAMDRLFTAVLSLKTLDECYRFFEDLCTVGELRALAGRFQVAELLHRGATYEEVQARTGASSATISRIKRFLLYGADGYRLALDRLVPDSEGPVPGAAPAAPADGGEPTGR